MGIVLKRIYMENYKLFDKRTIEFVDSLTVFDGPNGYGKTSTFDAIELLITGDISRVMENDAISAKLGYAESFLAKDQNRDVVIKGEFFNSANSKTVVIARRIVRIEKNSKTKKKDLNPKSLRGIVKTYFPASFDLPEEAWVQVPDANAKEECSSFFGAQNVSLYTLLHYVRQEDRLSFFKQSEEERTRTIEGLFGLTEYRKRLENATTIRGKLNTENKTLDSAIQSLSSEVDRRPKGAESVEYEPLAQGKPGWDEKYPDFRGAKRGDLLQELLTQLDSVEVLWKNRREFLVDDSTKEFRSLSEERQALALLAWKLCQEQENAAEILGKRRELQKFCHRQNGYLQKAQYGSVKWKELCQELGIPELAPEFTTLASQIEKSRKNQTELKQTLMDLDQARDVLQQQVQKTQMLEDGTCPYCGHNWGDVELLEAQFQKTKDRLRVILGREFVDCVFWTEQIKGMFQQHCGERLERLLRELDHDIALQIFCQYAKWQDFQNAAEACVPVIKRLRVFSKQILLGNTLDETINGMGEILKQAKVLWTSLSAEYVAQNQLYNFSKIFRRSFSSTEALEAITPEMLEKKRKYLNYQYSRSFDKSLEDLRCLKKKQDAINNLCKQIESYIESLTKAINAYRKQLIDHIEIPFFLYSSRLLQSYPGGQGILISTAEGDKIRFTAPGREHDVLYTMSSGQLSAVLLAFVLSLNRIYVGSGFRTMLIDDPIQCMDDINMVSLVELLGLEFGDSQVILSTHEDSFSKYIRHKYGRYGLPCKAVSLKDN